MYVEKEELNMDIQGLYGAGTAAQTARTAEMAKTSRTAVEAEDTAKETRKPKDVDTVEISKEGREAETKKLSSDQLKALQEQQVASFQNMIADILNNQAGQSGLIRGKDIMITKDLFSQLKVSPETSAAAAQAISEDGEWGVDAVAGRIMDMVVSMSGGDTSRLETFRNAVYKGFSQAERQWGGKLPDICSRTRDELDKRFDYLSEKGSMDGYVMGKTEPEK